MTIAERELSAEILAIEELEQAAHYLDLEPWIMMRLRQPERETHVNLQVHRESGETVMLRGAHVEHSTLRGPCMGPLVLAKGCTSAELRAEALRRTLQYALWGMPFGGSASSIPVELDGWSEQELRRVVCTFHEPRLGAGDSSIVTPARELPSQMMAWIAAGAPADREHLSRVTGKPVSMGGIDREYVAARFMAGLVRSALGRNLGGVQVALAGFDSIAQRTAVELELAGARIVAVADCSGAVYQRAGLNLELLREHVAREDVVFGFAEAQSMSLEDMMRTECDVLALSDGHEMKAKPAAKMIVEAGGKIAPELGCDDSVIPSLLGDFGASFADFLEWRKAECGFCSDREVMRGMQGQIRRTWQEVFGYARRHNLSLRRAAQVLALAKVAEAMRVKQGRPS
jgi:glutamate dehydrogenase (NAD(P)+)